jgi:hypothetical protein
MPKIPKTVWLQDVEDMGEGETDPDDVCRIKDASVLLTIHRWNDAEHRAACGKPPASDDDADDDAFILVGRS